MKAGVGVERHLVGAQLELGDPVLELPLEDVVVDLLLRRQLRAAAGNGSIGSRKG